ncbi:MAG: HNH endonuclease signature motif containing protein [Paracoccus sp. (in: a-proteobacteria)]|nr:HNH endonuclease signature motif containing protein [Paracoccus sp. (in: a-proteobacteria)]
MKIGQFVQRNITTIFDYCETRDPAELGRLQDARYSKEIFDINYPFCRRTDVIGTIDHIRYWRQSYIVNGIPVRVTSQWFNPPTSKSLPLFQRYLTNLGIEAHQLVADTASVKTPEATPIRAARGRYRGNAIGNAQNLLVRNILSRLGDEQFSETQWQAIKDAFGQTCAYCGIKGELLMDHIIPINRTALGEHRLGNLAPSCRDCNSRKAEKDYRDFLTDAPERLAAIEAHMEKHAYRQIGKDEQIRAIIDLAHQDVRHLADRYVAIINTILRGNEVEQK